MNGLAFDTHAIARRYKAAGFTDDQVEAMVDTAREAASLPDLSHLATKADVTELRVATNADLTELRVATKADLTELRVATKADLTELRAELRSTISESKVQMVMATLAIVGFADGLLFFLLRR